MDDEMERQAVAVDLHRHRIDQERHVVVDDLDDRMGRLPAVLFEAGIEDPDPRLARLALAGEVPVRQGRAVEIGRLALGEVLGIDVLEVAEDEMLYGRALRGRHFCAHELEHFVNTACAVDITVRAHRSLPPRGPPDADAICGGERRWARCCGRTVDYPTTGNRTARSTPTPTAFHTAQRIGALRAAWKALHVRKRPTRESARDRLNRHAGERSLLGLASQSWRNPWHMRKVAALARPETGNGRAR